MSTHLDDESSREARTVKHLTQRATRIPLALSFVSLASVLILGIALIPGAAARSAAPVAQEVVASASAKEASAHDAEQDKAIESLAAANAERARKGLPPVTLPQQTQDAVVNATLARVLAALPQGTQLTAADTARIANEAADIAQGRIIVPKPADIIPCLAQPGQCKGEVGIPGKDGQAGKDGQDGKDGVAGPQGVSVTDLRFARGDDGACTMIVELANPATGSTSTVTHPAPDALCGSTPVTTSPTIAAPLVRRR